MSLFLADVKREPWLFLRHPASPWTREIVETEKRIRVALARVAAFEISNVAEYLYCGNEQEDWDIFSDFPKPAPPFAHTWFEWRLPAVSYSNGSRIPIPMARAACFVEARVIENLVKVTLVPFVRRQSGLHVHGIVIYNLTREMDAISPSSDGKILLGNWGGYPPDEFKSEALQLAEMSTSIVFPAFLAMSLLNCRNVRTRKVQAPERLVKACAKRGRPIPAMHRVIEIQPITEVTKRETGESGYSQKAISVIRGHFKDYSQGRGLFGKLRGRFWWNGRMNANASVEYALAGTGKQLDPQWIRQ